MDRIFGGPIIPTLLKLVLLSFVVGLVFAILGIDPLDLWRNFGDTIQRMWELLGDTVQWGFKYAILGAVVVLPVWIIYRLLRAVAAPKKG